MTRTRRRLVAATILTALAVPAVGWSLLNRTLSVAGSAQAAQAVQPVVFDAGTNDDGLAEAKWGSDGNDDGTDPQTDGTRADWDMGTCTAAPNGSDPTVIDVTLTGVASEYQCLLWVETSAYESTGDPVRLQTFTLADSGTGTPWTAGIEFVAYLASGSCGATVAEGAGSTTVGIVVEVDGVEQGAVYGLAGLLDWEHQAGFDPAAC